MTTRRAVDTENFVLTSGLRLLGLIGIAARRRTLDYWSARASELPLRNRQGTVLDERPVDTEPPPLIAFASRHRTDGEIPQ